MEWHNTAFKFEDSAKLCKKELDEAGIKTDYYIIGDGYYYIGWMPIGKEQFEIGLKIIVAHID